MWGGTSNRTVVVKVGLMEVWRCLKIDDTRETPYSLFRASVRVSMGGSFPFKFAIHERKCAVRGCLGVEFYGASLSRQAQKYIQKRYMQRNCSLHFFRESVSNFKITIECVHVLPIGYVKEDVCVCGLWFYSFRLGMKIKATLKQGSANFPSKYRELVPISLLSKVPFHFGFFHFNRRTKM